MRPIHVGKLPGLAAKVRKAHGKPMTPGAKLLKQSAKDKLVSAFDRAWKDNGGPLLTSELKFAEFAKPPRKFRLDRAHVLSRVAIEIHGGVWSSGRHTRGPGFINDRKKMNLALSMGWVVFELADKMIEDREQLQAIIECIRMRCEVPASKSA